MDQQLRSAFETAKDIWTRYPILRILGVFGLLSTGITLGVTVRAGFFFVPIAEVPQLFLLVGFYLSVTVFVILTFYYGWMTFAHIITSPTTIFRRRIELSSRYNSIASMLATVATVATVIYFLVEPNWWMDDFSPQAAIFPALAVLMLATWVYTKIPYTLYGFLNFAALGSLFVGLHIVEILRQQEPSVCLFVNNEQTPTKGTLFFSTTKGLFVYLPGKNHPHFYAWESIQRIIPVSPSHHDGALRFSGICPGASGNR